MFNRNDPKQIQDFSEKNILDLIGKPLISFDETQSNSIHATTRRILSPVIMRRRSGVRHNSVDFERILTSLQDPEELELKKHEKLIIKSNNRYKLIFDIIIDILVIYSTTTSLFYLAFVAENPDSNSIDLLVTVLFTLDFILSFFTEVIDKRKRHILNLNMIAKHYACTWLVPDLCSIIPLSFTGNPNTEYAMRLFRIGKIARLYRLVNIKKFGKVMSELLYKTQHRKKRYFRLLIDHIWDLFQELTAMLFVSYALACYWWFYADLIVRRVHVNANFIDTFNLAQYSGISQVIRVWYFIFSSMMTVGYGDFTATNLYERALLSIILIIGPTWFAFTIGKALNTVKRLKEIDGTADLGGQLGIWLSNVERKHLQIPHRIKDKVKKYYLNYWKNDRLGKMGNIADGAWNYEELVRIQDPFLAVLPQNLREEILDHIFGDIFSKFSYFFDRQSKWKYSLCLYLQPRIYFENEIIIKENHPVLEILFVVSGKILIGFNYANEFQEIFRVKDYEIIGDFFVLDQSPSFLCYMAIDTVHGYWVPADIANAIILKTSHHYTQYFAETKRNYMSCKHKKEKTLRSLRESRISLSSVDLLIDSDLEESIHIEATVNEQKQGLESLNRISHKMRYYKNNLSRTLKDRLVDLLISKHHSSEGLGFTMK